jgi:signal transduction histidine kinase
LLEEGGLHLALSSLIRGLSSRMNMAIELNCDCCAEGRRLPAEIEVALYRVTQEALMNVHKHASATRVRVRCGREGDDLVVTVEDNGTGIGGRERCHVGSGVGIDGMRARLAQLGGKLVLSNLRVGTRLRAIVPIDWSRV